MGSSAPSSLALRPWPGCSRRDFVRRCAAGCVAAGGPPAARCVETDPQALALARREFEGLAAAATTLDQEARIDFVNAAINLRLDYLPDPASAPGGDLWLTPCEALARGAGDCEDFAITKFFLLLASGAPLRGVRLLYARRVGGDRPAEERLPHLVAVAQWPFADPWVLDSLNPLCIVLSRRDDLQPVFSFDQTELWPGVETRPPAVRREPLTVWRTTALRSTQQLH